ncbi:hypothetical protein MMC30_004549 [Trapelia coarctata]|nr:hypothetical protein [Trapelia coarctata]
MDLAPSSRPFPLLRLPRELRNSIYRHLLWIPYVIDRDDEYRMQPAILFVNRQTSAEAQIILNENYFVVLELDQKNRGNRNWFCRPGDIPKIHNLSARPGSFVTPLLQIRLREDITGNESAAEMAAKDNNTVLHLIGPEAIPHIIDLLWDNAFLHNENEDSVLPLSSMTLELTLTNQRFSHRQQEIEELLFPPFQLVTFRDVTVFIATAAGNATLNPPRPLNTFPKPADVKRRMRDLMAKGQERYDAGKYVNACKGWYRFERYRAWISTIVTNNALAGNLPAVRGPLVRALQKTFPLLLQAFLETTKALIRLEDWGAAFNLAMDATWYADSFIRGYSEYCAKFRLCISLARYGKEYMHNKDWWLRDLLEVIPPLKREPQCAMLLPRVLKEHYWAMAAFPDGSENFRYFSTRKYWDLLGVKDSDEIPIHLNTWLSRLDAFRENEYKRTLRAVTREAHGF